MTRSMFLQPARDKRRPTVRRMVIPLDNILIKYVPGGGAVLLTGKGRCAVCGRLHNTKDEWKRCAKKRISKELGEPVPLFLPKVYSPELDDYLPYAFSSAFLFRIEVAVKKPDPALVASIPEENIEKAREELLHLLEEARRRVKEKVKELLSVELSRRTSNEKIRRLLREGLVEDAVGYYLLEQLLRRDPLVVGSETNWKSGIFSEWNVDRSRYVESWKQPFSKWLLSKVDWKGALRGEDEFRGKPFDWKVRGGKLAWVSRPFVIVITLLVSPSRMKSPSALFVINLRDLKVVKILTFNHSYEYEGTLKEAIRFIEEEKGNLKEQRIA